MIEAGMPMRGLDDESVASLLDGLCEELDLASFSALQGLSLPTLRRMARVEAAARGVASPQVLATIRLREI